MCFRCLSFETPMNVSLSSGRWLFSVRWSLVWVRWPLIRTRIRGVPGLWVYPNVITRQIRPELYGPIDDHDHVGQRSAQPLPHQVDRDFGLGTHIDYGRTSSQIPEIWRVADDERALGGVRIRGECRLALVRALEPFKRNSRQQQYA